MTDKELIKHLRDRVEDINHNITISQSYEAKCFLDGKRKGFQYVLDLLEVKKDEWISVNDRLPEINEDVIVSDIETDKTYSGYYVGNGLWECDNGVFEGRVTHWKPFPAPCLDVKS